MSQEQYERVCKNRFDTLDTAVRDNTDLLREMHRKMFEGNGKPSITEQLQEHATKIAMIIGVGGVFGTAVIVAVVSLWFGKA